MAIYRQETFTDERGDVITSRTPIDDSAPTTYHAQFQFGFSVHGKPVQVNLFGHIPGDTIEEAFANLADAGKAAHVQAEQNLRAELAKANAPKLVLAGQTPAANLNGHAGRIGMMGGR